MILLDTNIVGTFALIGALDLLFALFAKDKIGISPAVYAELVAGVREGRQFLQSAVKLAGGWEVDAVRVDGGRSDSASKTANVTQRW
ncbi:type II toxin-antitoxin system VapC family toxin [Candidatus Poribacteria bacterium]|nr:type II toxin-antitoxin system VapC family toxin [Candidatus Poribacteria bacterium]